MDAVNACLIPAAALDGQEVVTAEGLGTPDDLHPVQREMAVRGGSQCGYCTPGLRLQHGGRVLPGRPRRGQRRRARRRRDDEHGANGFDLHALSGNLCRCTGYRPIQDAAYALGEPAADDPLAARGAPSRAGARRTRLDGRRRRVRPARRPRRGPASCSPTARTPSWSPARPTGASRSTSAASGRRSSSPSTGSPSCAGSRSVSDGRARRRADPHRDRAPAGRADPAAGPAVPAVRLAADPQRRHDRRQPRHRLADRRRPAGAARARGRASCWRRSTASARCRSPTTSPATARRSARPAS